MRQSPPLVGWHISCGFSSPADDYRESELDINELVIAHPEATLYVRVSGDSMEGAGICEGDVLNVDRAPEHGRTPLLLPWSTVNVRSNAS